VLGHQPGAADARSESKPAKQGLPIKSRVTYGLSPESEGPGTLQRTRSCVSGYFARFGRCVSHYGEGVNRMEYNPEKTNANTSGEKQPKQQPDRDKVARGVGSVAVNGPKK
jgi:hypothetical protein